MPISSRVRDAAQGRDLSARPWSKSLRCGRRVDTFFDKVLVNAKDERVRNNRLTLLHKSANRIFDDRRFLGNRHLRRPKIKS